jgi:hypothetical protein
MVFSTAAFNGSSGVICTGAGGGTTVILLTTDLTPFTLFAADSAPNFSDSPDTCPESVTTPSLTSVEIPERYGTAAMLLSTAALTSASFGLLLQDVTKAIKKINASTGLILLIIVDGFELIKTQVVEERLATVLG